MPITDLCTNLLTGLTSSGECLRVDTAAHNEIAQELAKPAHLFVELYTLRYREQVMIYAVGDTDGIPCLRVQRGMGGTSARAWPSGACLRVLQSVDGAPCGTDDDDEQTDLLSSLLSMLNIGRGLELVDGINGPTLRLASTGVLAGEYGDAVVSATGQFEFIPNGWPASATPAFDACCGDDPGPGPGPGPGGVQRVEGLAPDAAGNVSFCGRVPAGVPVDDTAPVFICASGQMATTTVGDIIGLVSVPPAPDLSPFVTSVGGLTPVAGAVSFGDAPTTTSVSAATVLVQTGSGVAQVAVSDLLGSGGGSVGSLTVTYNPSTGEADFDLSGQTETETFLPTFNAGYVGTDLVITHGPDTYTLTPPAASTTVVLSFDGDAELEVEVNGVSAKLNLPFVTAIPTETGTLPPGTNYKLLRLADGSYRFVPDL